ncbi:MAG: PKD domain-containing protein [Propionibacteriaceae bacterium]|nr:PKD domain-containing protein [Propionibacteriaceae bacterium]
MTPDAPLIGDRNEAMDVVLVLDATSSMQNRWASAVQAIKSAMLLFHEIDVRFALVTYQDHPTGGGVPGNYPTRLHQDFTADPEVFRQALDSVELAPAGDPPEAVYSGIMTALNLSTWRANASKTVLVVGDGPAKDPEPVTGYTWAQIRNRAYSASTPQVSILGDAELTDNPALVQLATETGGNITTQPEDTDPTEAITQELEQLSAAPVAWLQGPYVDKVGATVTLDARASYAPGNGEIVKYEWDFDGDGTFDRTSATGETLYRYDSEIIGHARVRVTDKAGRTAIAATELAMTRDGDLIPDEFDNCPDLSNPTQQDANQNWIGDSCDDPALFEPQPEPPTPSPSASASPTPSAEPSGSPSASSEPSLSPSTGPTTDPTISPSIQPTASPSASPSPSLSPTALPIPSPTGVPSPSMTPSAPTPTGGPTDGPTSPAPPTPTSSIAPSSTSSAPATSSPARPDPGPGTPGLPKTGTAQ